MSKTAFIFPGQGSQALGMLSDFADRPAVKQTFAEASGALDLDLWALCQDGPKEALNQTENTQPLLLTAGVALWRLWEQSGGPRPQFLAGHSLGEYTALSCAGVINLGDAVRLVRTRGQLMQEAVAEGQGKMAAVLGLDDDQVRAACEQAANGDVVEAVNFNAPGQVVIAGSAEAVERAIAACKEAGAKRAMPLPVSVPSHCALMKPAAEKLAETLNNTNFHAAEMPVINNVDVAVETDPAQIRDALIRQLYSPVRWVETVQALKEQGVIRVYECGPGKVLGGLIKRIDRDVASCALETADAFEAALTGQ
ncbi:malonyl CoA-ACP transacylase [Alcanivorax sp. MD8A]|uniref:ACP S-malonyltransferase n=1 Tax=Alcanivorax TaxID=59753 RepID=UPI0003B79634|nr:MULTISPECIES: ACP S-malonyltransferase [unclassified Alcanivorax]ERP92317.1 malonyl CoA-ACP transacylase [Alcanivorax sp. P2S70]MED5432253.1 ACP S-malonyltransferase [Pseudomonadota bacterium]MEE2869808.1 ACP S-malonyltransferase [Pseudomonadota bacterium]PNE02570.1 malonyl CoA-ACP transacylase [Alcanivorax sp. MD8A]